MNKKLNTQQQTEGIVASILSAMSRQDAFLMDTIIPSLQELGTPEGMEKSNKAFVASLDKPPLTANERQEAFRVATLKRVYDLIDGGYELNETERDLVLDTRETGLERLDPYPQTKQGFIADLPQHRDIQKGLEGYLYAFLDMWQGHLEADGKFRWRVVYSDNYIVIIFTTQAKDDGLPPLQKDEVEWAGIERVVKLSGWKFDDIVRLVTDNEIIIKKRNEHHLWTRSKAREDARATFVQEMCLQEKDSDNEKQNN